MTKPILTFAVAGVLTMGLAAPASAQDYPQRTIRIVVPFGPGGGSDIVARIIGAVDAGAARPAGRDREPARRRRHARQRGGRARRQGRLHDRHHDRRPDHRGGDEQVAALRHAHCIRSGLADRDRRPDHRHAAGLRRPTTSRSWSRPPRPTPASSSFASPGFGATQHFTAELFRQTADINMLQVPFRTSPEAISAVLGKQVDVLFDTVSAVLGQVQCGQLKALAVTGKDRFPAVPRRAGGDRIGRAARLRRHHLVRLLRAARHAARSRRQAQHDAQRGPQG